MDEKVRGSVISGTAINSLKVFLYQLFISSSAVKFQTGNVIFS